MLNAVLAALFLVGPVWCFNGLSSTFWNLSNRKLRVYWIPDNGGAPMMQTNVPGKGGESSLTAYVGHRFFWSEVSSNPPKPIDAPEAIFEIREKKFIYAIQDSTTTPDLVEKLQTRLQFMQDYYNRTGIQWLSYYPRDPPTLFMWPADRIGQQHKITMSPQARQHVCDPKKDSCRSPEENLIITCVATKPRVFMVENFLTDYESDWVIESARPHMKRSTTGHGEDASENSVRSSLSWWLLRGHAGHDIADSIYRRIADIINIPHELLYPDRNAESINVLHYKQGQEYTPHYDWWSQGRPEYRYISMLLYFSTPTKGGGTSFPMGVNADGTVGIRVKAEKNRAVFFYDILPDGNVDEFSLHSGEPVEEGEKWVGPLWIWEPNVVGGKSPDDILRAQGYDAAQGARPHTEL